MAEDGGDMARPSSANRSKPPLRPRYSRPTPPRPERRPGSIWVLSIFLVCYGLLGALVSTMVVQDAVSHGADDDVIVLAVISGLLAVTQLASGLGIFFGKRWGRTGALTVGGLNILTVVVVLLGVDGLSDGQAWTAVAVNGVLLFALIGPKVHDWTGGDR